MGEVSPPAPSDVVSPPALASAVADVDVSLLACDEAKVVGSFAHMLFRASLIKELGLGRCSWGTDLLLGQVGRGE